MLILMINASVNTYSITLIHSNKMNDANRAKQKPSISINFAFRGSSIKKMKDEHSVIIYSPSCHSKSEGLSFFCGKQKVIF